VPQYLTPHREKDAVRGFVLRRFDGGKLAERWAAVTPPGEDV
jgi:hypothetical protein